MNYYNYCFDEIENTGDTIRRKNKIKAKNLMNIAVSFNDEETLQKIQNILFSLSPEEMQIFKNYLNDRKFLRMSNHNSEEQKVINKIVGIAVSSVPKDKYLRDIYEEYTKNLNIIDEIKIRLTKTTNYKELNILMEKLDDYNERNVELLNMINNRVEQ
ncbi:MAG: hypothetical protein A2104_01480 [Candidatus Melainabacteria bacterium GWF2_32_7]|nr:MAG: hypothetical protein A2104_01480 [Candidatus Melainabacteria bacterium GWF2_32_7]